MSKRRSLLARGNWGNGGLAGLNLRRIWPLGRRTRVSPELFCGETLAEAITAVRQAYGPDATVLGTRSRRRYGPFGRQVVEVLVDPGEQRASSPSPGPQRTAPGYQPEACGRRRQASRQGPTASSRRQEAANGLSDVPGRRSGESAGAGGVRGSLEDLLRTAGIAPDLAIVLATNSLAGGRSPLVSTKHLGARLGEAIAELIGRPRPVETSPGGKRTVAFIGPHGAGKTTALVKVACRLALEGGFRVALVTADTHRLAAAEQLARYAAVLELDFAVAYTPGELRRHCSTNEGVEVTLVDTPGHVWRSPDDLAGLGAVLEAAAPDEVHLVFPATRDLGSVEHAMYAYRPLGVDRLLISKLDEAESYGPVLNLAASTKLPLSYLGLGPDVPGLLDLPDAAQIARAVLAGRTPGTVGGREPGETEKEAGVVG